MSLEEVIRSATSRAGIVRVRNALNPLLWGCATVSPTSWGAAYAFNSDPVLRYAFAGTGALPIVGLLLAYLYFMVRDPDRLQSEEFVLKQQELRITERKGLPPIQIDVVVPDELPSSSNNGEE